ncbi:MAG: Cof-type HAD-IIB family hydrolase [Bacteroidaceae bacterium]|nr:Cof-type HAD-IIB family hydrolase [Bacteroidaceae bacterium]
MIRAVFLDIDGTLVSFRTHQVPTSTTRAVSRIRQMGVKVFIATGRPRPFIDNLSALPYDGLICTNGAACLEADGTCFYTNPIPRQDIARLVEHLRHSPVPIIFANNERAFITNPTTRAEEVTHIANMLNLPSVPTLPTEEALATDILQAVAFFHPDEEKHILDNVLRGTTANRWCPYFADFVAQGTNKAVGIDVMLRHYGIALADTLAFGDGGNDIEMLRHVAIGVAMGNASEDVKAAADITTSSVDEDGVARVLNELIPGNA